MRNWSTPAGCMTRKWWSHCLPKAQLWSPAYPPAGRRHLAHAARNNDLAAVRLMLKAGLPVDAVSQHHSTALHWAAWHGNVEMVQLILQHQPEHENTDTEFKPTPL